jgi:hypothetical protein
MSVEQALSPLIGLQIQNFPGKITLSGPIRFNLLA